MILEEGDLFLNFEVFGELLTMLESLFLELETADDELASFPTGLSFFWNFLTDLSSNC